MADDTFVFLVRTGQEAGNVHQGQDGNIKAIAGPDEPGAFVRRVHIQTAAHAHGLVGHHAGAFAVKADKASHNVIRE